MINHKEKFSIILIRQCFDTYEIHLEFCITLTYFLKKKKDFYVL